jgi:hypothetical protein
VCKNGNMRSVETIPGTGGGRNKENDGGVNSIIVRTFVSVTMYPRYNKSNQGMKT